MITGIFGMPRSGKTVWLARYIHKYAYKYDHIYIAGEYPDMNYFPKDFITFIHPYDIGAFKPVINSLFVLCEAGTYFNNRLSSSIPAYCTNFFALHGHYKCDILWDSQSVDVDKKLRDRTNRLFIAKKSLISCFTRIIPVGHSVGVNPETQDLTEIYTVPSTFLQRFLFTITFRSYWFYRPKYYGIFDTHSDVLFEDNGYLLPQVFYSQVPQKYLNEVTIKKDYENIIKQQKK